MYLFLIIYGVEVDEGGLLFLFDDRCQHVQAIAAHAEHVVWLLRGPTVLLCIIILFTRALDQNLAAEVLALLHTMQYLTLAFIVVVDIVDVFATAIILPLF